jgi:GNAT superfamily N-acetyltransferase
MNQTLADLQCGADAPAAQPRVLRFRDELTHADAERIGELVVATGFFNAAEIGVARELVDEHLATRRASGYWFLLAESGADLAGYACFGPVPATACSWHLYWIAVAPAWQGRQVGQRLLDQVETRIRAAGGARLYAETSSRPQYAPTRQFYTHTGFREVAALPDFFGPGDGKVILQKDLRPGPDGHAPRAS